MDMMQAAVTDLPEQGFIGLIVGEGVSAVVLQFLLAQIHGFPLGQESAEDQPGR
ncbi:hypothetical protein D3C84_1067530 [compost metagenome]